MTFDVTVVDTTAPTVSASDVFVELIDAIVDIDIDYITGEVTDLLPDPDVVLVLDSSLLEIMDVTDGLKPGGTLVVNSKEPVKDLASRFHFEGSLWAVDATHIARELLGRPITNTTMLGALLRATGIVDIDSVSEPLRHRFGLIAAKNEKALREAYDKVEKEEITP